MSRTIDLSKRLSEDDREYLLARGREQDVFANDSQFTDDEEAARVAAYIPGTSVDTAEGVPVTKGGDPLVNNGGGISQGTPKFATPANQVESGEAADAGVGALQVEHDSTEEEAAEDYSGEEWTKERLVEEIERRNATYGEEYQLAKGGSKKQMAARLVADDNTPEDDEDDEDSES